MTGRRHTGEIPRAQAEAVGANIRILRQRNGWTQVTLGALMGWPSSSTVCAAEGHRGGRQRGFTLEEIQRLASIFGLTIFNCGGYRSGVRSSLVPVR